MKNNYDFPSFSFIVTPENDIQGSLSKFKWHNVNLKDANQVFKVESHDGPKTIELIFCESQGIIEYAVENIGKKGFIPAPSPYLLGLGIQYPKVIEERGYIVSLDENNIFSKGNNNNLMLVLKMVNKEHGGGLCLIEKASGGYGGFWCPVIRK